MAQQGPPKYNCPYCNTDLKYIPQYAKWWCEMCHIYPYERSEVNKAADDIDDIFSQLEDEFGTRSCNYCGIRMVYVDQYRQWWCPNCKRYTSLPTPPPPPPPPQPSTSPSSDKDKSKKHSDKDKSKKKSK
jgi:predicted RNA-binding Zn-ribbon protein involved in translation (DUF1610 family)